VDVDVTVGFVLQNGVGVLRRVASGDAGPTGFVLQIWGGEGVRIGVGFVLKNGVLGGGGIVSRGYIGFDLHFGGIVLAAFRRRDVDGTLGFLELFVGSDEGEVVFF
jgi:hypothetical protein